MAARDRLQIAVLAALATAFAASASFGATCSDCHGMPPIDAPYRNVTTGGFKGSHLTHLPASAQPSSCAPCHSGSASYQVDHMDGVIQMASNINSSPVASLYGKGVFFNQTSVPVMGSCSNVNCHFEAATPAWSGTPLTVPAGCASCHGAAPADGNHPSASGAGAKHGVRLGTDVNSCLACHPNHAAEAKPFAHATSAGHRGLTVSFAGPYPGGSYSGSVGYPAYLPSQSPPRNGTCSNTYCHSPGTSKGPTFPAPAQPAVWGTTFSSPCGACHVDMSSSASATGSHLLHAQTAGYGCAVCHNGAGSGTTLHANGTIELSFGGTGAGTVYSTGSHAPGTAYGSCSASLCHGSGTPVWGANTTVVECEKCHGSAATSPFRSTAGATANTDAKTGAHLDHLQAASAGHKYTSNIACSECHTVPATITAAGHIDTAGPAEIVFGPLAKTGGLAPTYNATTRQCANTYCHGNTLDKPSTAVLTPTWNSPFLTGVASNDCGKCHGYPPATSTGHPAATPTQCAGCHPHVNATGTGFVDATKHMNGVIDATGAHAVPNQSHYQTAGTGTACTGCHADSNASAPYPAGTAPNYTAPDCRACHKKAAPGTVGCGSCHGSSTNGGRPTGTAFPDRAGHHGGDHGSYACATCHAGGGTGTTTHGNSNHVVKTQSNVVVKFSSPAPTTGTWNGTSCTLTCNGENHSNKVW